jgi:hypothetical protein
MISQTNNDKLRIFSLIFDIIGDDRHILEVQSSIDFIEDIKRRRFVMMQGEDETKRGKSLLSS